jgi:hypothetical protein
MALIGWWLVWFAGEVWGWLRWLCGGPRMTVLVLAYVVGAVVWGWCGFPGPSVVPVVVGAGWVVLMLGVWVTHHAPWLESWMVRVDEEEFAEQTADLDGRWREIRADAAWVRSGRPEA